MRVRGSRLAAALLVLLGIAGGALQATMDITALDVHQLFLPAVRKVQLTAIVLEPFVAGLDNVTNIVHAGDERLFISNKEGVIYVVDGAGDIADQPFLDLTDRVNSSEFEMGFLGLVFHPEYAENGGFYAYYTNEDGDSVLSRFSVSPTNLNVADPESEAILLEIYQPTIRHHGGALAFGPNDGYLYIASGDGGSITNAQDREVLLGKILRIDVDSGEPYAVPGDNPFVGDSDARAEIWALGVRNPWRISFDSETGDLFIADVGETDWEEVNVQPATSSGGENYGWPCYEAMATAWEGECEDGEDYVFPDYAYPHTDGNCSITGGYAYRGSSFPSVVGRYIFADFCSGRFWAMSDYGDGSWSATFVGQHRGKWPSAFGQDVQGEIYVGGYEGVEGVFRVGWSE